MKTSNPARRDSHRSAGIDLRTMALAAALAATLLAGCASPAPRYYSLADTALPTAPAPLVADRQPMAIEITPVAMPERYARPQMVLRSKGAKDDPQVDVLEDSRWSSSFEDELRDALASGVSLRLGAVDATRGPRPQGARVTRVAVQMQRFDAMQDRGVDSAFTWTVRPSDQASGLSCRVALSEPAAGGVDAVAASAQRVVAKLSDAIARSVSSARCPAS